MSETTESLRVVDAADEQMTRDRGAVFALAEELASISDGHVAVSVFDVPLEVFEERTDLTAWRVNHFRMEVAG